MTVQYLRKTTLKIGNQTEALDFSELHFRFTVRNSTAQTLKYAELTIYNLSDATAQKIQNEFTMIELSAGYEGNAALIFQGQIAYLERGKEDATTTFLTLRAQDGDQAFNHAYSNWTLAQGYRPDDVYNRFLQDLAPYGITAGYKPTFAGNPSVDAFSCFGKTREHLRNFALKQGCQWSIENGQLNFLPKGQSFPGAVPIIGPASGLIGTPTQTIGGINMTCLLNPMIRAGSKVQLDNSLLTSTTIRFPITGSQAGDQVAGLDPGGFYTAVQVIHDGDTRGNVYYTHIVGVAVDGTAPSNTALLNEVPEV